MPVIATKKGMTKTFTDKAWELLPPNKNGWRATNVPVEKPKEVVKVEPPAETIPLPKKVSIEAPKRGRKANDNTTK